MKYLIFAASIALVVFWIVREVRADYEYDRSVGSYWALSDKASTLQQKSAYLDSFVNTIQNAGLSGNNAVFFKTPDNSYTENMIALKSLQGRMHQIQGMDEQSFAYQTAIQQITAQEQGEGTKLTDTFEGIWYLSNYPTLWDWYDLLCWIGMVLFIIGSGIAAFAY